MPRPSASPPGGGTRARHQREDPVAAWLDHLRVERGLGANTLVAYERDLRVLAAFAERARVRSCSSRPPTSPISRGSCAARAQARSQARHVFSIRGFFGFAVREGLIERDPTENVRAPRAFRAPAALSQPRRRSRPC